MLGPNCIEDEYIRYQNNFLNQQDQLYKIAS